jgi:DNA-directed RNA polymerase subunit K/omega
MFDLKLYGQALEVIPEHYMLVNAMSMRIRQLQGGVEPLVEPEGLSLFDIALKEIVEKKIQVKRLEDSQTITLATGEMDG